MARRPGEWRVVSNRFGDIRDEMLDRVNRGIVRITSDLEANAKANVVSMGAVDTGNMLGSIQGEMLTANHGQVTVGAEYGIYVNNGTFRMAPRPFFDRAVAVADEQFAAVVAAALKGAS